MAGIHLDPRRDLLRADFSAPAMPRNTIASGGDWLKLAVAAGTLGLLIAGRFPMAKRVAARLLRRLIRFLGRKVLTLLRIFRPALVPAAASLTLLGSVSLFRLSRFNGVQPINLTALPLFREAPFPQLQTLRSQERPWLVSLRRFAEGEVAVIPVPPLIASGLKSFGTRIDSAEPMEGAGNVKSPPSTRINRTRPLPRFSQLSLPLGVGVPTRTRIATNPGRSLDRRRDRDRSETAIISEQVAAGVPREGESYPTFIQATGDIGLIPHASVPSMPPDSHQGAIPFAPVAVDDTSIPIASATSSLRTPSEGQKGFDSQLISGALPSDPPGEVLDLGGEPPLSPPSPLLGGEERNLVATHLDEKENREVPTGSPVDHLPHEPLVEGPFDDEISPHLDRIVAWVPLVPFSPSIQTTVRPSPFRVRRWEEPGDPSRGFGGSPQDQEEDEENTGFERDA